MGAGRGIKRSRTNVCYPSQPIEWVGWIFTHVKDRKVLPTRKPGNADFFGGSVIYSPTIPGCAISSTAEQDAYTIKAGGSTPSSRTCSFKTEKEDAMTQLSNAQCLLLLLMILAACSIMKVAL